MFIIYCNGNTRYPEGNAEQPTFGIQHRPEHIRLDYPDNDTRNNYNKLILKCAIVYINRGWSWNAQINTIYDNASTWKMVAGKAPPWTVGQSLGYKREHNLVPSLYGWERRPVTNCAPLPRLLYICIIITIKKWQQFRIG